jgi:subtilisin family serine protease
VAVSRAAGGGLARGDADAAAPTSVIVETREVDAIAEKVGDGAEIEKLSETFTSVRADVDDLLALAQDSRVRRVQTKKTSQPHLDAVGPDIGLGPLGSRPVPEDGTGVVVAVVDSGFDLSHPMFRDAAGNLRVDALLDQTRQAREFSTADLEQGWRNGTNPGADPDGHGTHVASIAAGSRFGQLEGVAPRARLLLVKTNFIDTDQAVAWAFRKAGARPCVANLSLGHHFGAHDGTDSEEQLHTQLTGPGKIVVVSAGNEREDDLHIGGRFHPDQIEEVTFDLQRQQDGSAFVVLTLWHPRADRFSISLIPPGGNAIAEPPLGRAIRPVLGAVSIEMGHLRYLPSDLVQHQIGIQVPTQAPNNALRGWRVRIQCRTAVVGRLDGWFNNSGFATFRPHALVENARTIGLSATGPSCLAVASHVTRNNWQSDAGAMQDPTAVLGRSSSFSSTGPTRDGRQKPDVSAPGERVTAALAAGSDMAGDDRFAATANRTLTIRGTSMSAPVVTGAVALLLQKKPNRTPTDLRIVLEQSVRRDGHTGPGPWDPVYGLGKLDVVSALRV